MAVSLYRFKPAHTSFITVEVIVSYSCTEPPKVEKYDICGLKQFAVILSSEYEVTPIVHSWKRKPCEAVTDCDHPVAYDLELKAFVKDVIGLGIGIGKIGTGTLGIRFRSTEETLHLTTECVCCDEEDEKRAATQFAGYAADSAALAAIAWFVGMTAFSSALALALLNHEQSSLLARAFVDVVSIGATASLIAAVVRLFAYSRRRMWFGQSKRDRTPTGR